MNPPRFLCASCGDTWAWEERGELVKLEGCPTCGAPRVPDPLVPTFLAPMRFETFGAKLLRRAADIVDRGVLAYGPDTLRELARDLEAGECGARDLVRSLTTTGRGGHA